MKHLFSGYDVTIFAYGVTGTGKTHTMRGGKSLADRGVIPRLLSSIYRRCRKQEKDGETQVEVSMSYYEIYNDRVYDLFEPPEKRTAAGLPIRDNNGKTVVVGLTERPCTTLKEFEKLYDEANVNRSTSATKVGYCGLAVSVCLKLILRSSMLTPHDHTLYCASKSPRPPLPTLASRRPAVSTLPGLRTTGGQITTGNVSLNLLALTSLCSFLRNASRPLARSKHGYRTESPR